MADYSKLEKAYKAVHKVGLTADSKAAMDAAWNESDHPRAENGEFGSGGGGGEKSNKSIPAMGPLVKAHKIAEKELDAAITAGKGVAEARAKFNKANEDYEKGLRWWEQ